MKHHTQPAREQKYQNYVLKKPEYSQTRIAALRKIHKKTISRELGRNFGQRSYGRSRFTYWPNKSIERNHEQ